MRRYVFLCFAIFSSTACNSALLTGSGKQARAPKYSQSKNADAKDDPFGEMPDNLEEGLEQTLDIVQQTVGDSEFIYKDYTFANWETILTEALDFVQERGIDPDMDEENPLFEDRSDEEIREFLSEFSLGYGEYSETGSDEGASLKLLQSSAASTMFDTTFAKANKRWASDPSSADLAFARIGRYGGEAVASGYQAANQTQQGGASEQSTVGSARKKATAANQAANQPVVDETPPATTVVEGKPAFNTQFEQQVFSFTFENTYFFSWFDWLR